MLITLSFTSLIVQIKHLHTSWQTTIHPTFTSLIVQIKPEQQQKAAMMYATFTSLIVQIKPPASRNFHAPDLYVYIPHSSDKTLTAKQRFYSFFVVYIPHSSDKTNTMGHRPGQVQDVYIPHSSDKTRLFSASCHFELSLHPS